jgi:hypothetical protein
MRTELQAMEVIAATLEPLEPEARARIIKWVIQAMAISGSDPSDSAMTKFQAVDASASEKKLSTFAECFHAAAPNSEKDKALVAAYWTHMSSGASQFGSQQLNTELKHIGYGVANITDALNQLIVEKPNLVIQISKSGSSQQARKTYKITDAGIRRVKEMIDANSGDGQ